MPFPTAMEGFLAAAVEQFLLPLVARVLQLGVYVTPGQALESVIMVLKVIAMPAHLAAAAAALLDIPAAAVMAEQGIAQQDQLRLLAAAVAAAARDTIMFAALLEVAAAAA